MKRTKFILVALLAVILMSFAAQRIIVVKMPEDKMNFHWQNLNGIKQTLYQSDLPHRQVVSIIQAIDTLQKDLQAGASVDTTMTSQTPKK